MKQLKKKKTEETEGALSQFSSFELTIFLPQGLKYFTGVHYHVHHNWDFWMSVVPRTKTTQVAQTILQVTLTWKRSLYPVTVQFLFW